MGRRRFSLLEENVHPWRDQRRGAIARNAILAATRRLGRKIWEKRRDAHSLPRDLRILHKFAPRLIFLTGMRCQFLGRHVDRVRTLLLRLALECVGCHDFLDLASQLVHDRLGRVGGRVHGKP